MNIFATRTMLAAYQNAKKPETFLRDTFFKNVKPYDTAEIAIDSRKRRRKMAPFVSGYLAGNMVQRQGFQTTSFEAPYIKPFTRTKAEDFINQRAFGEVIGGAMSPEGRAMQALGEDIAMLDEMIDAREEWMCAQLLFNGFVPIEGEGLKDVELAFWKAADSDAPYTALTSSAYWTAAGSDPLANIGAGVKVIRANSQVQPDIAIFGSGAADAFMKNETMLKQLDNRRVEIGEIKPEDLPGGVSYLGRITKSGLNIFTYDGSYEADGNGAVTPLVPTDKVLIGSSRAAPTTLAYGMVTYKDEQTGKLVYVADRRVPTSRVEGDPAGRIVQMLSRPLPLVHETHGFHVLKVVA